MNPIYKTLELQVILPLHINDKPMEPRYKGSNEFDSILQKHDEAGMLNDLLGNPWGKIARLGFNYSDQSVRSIGSDELLSRQFNISFPCDVSFSFEEWIEMGKPLKLKETRTYEISNEDDE